MSLTSCILKLRSSIKTGIYSVSATVLRNRCLNRIDFPTPPVPVTIILLPISNRLLMFSVFIVFPLYRTPIHS